MGEKQKIVIFDFDGTLTTNDTLIAFIRYACGNAAFVWGFLLHLPLLVLMKLRLYDNGKTKERVFSYFFRGWTEERFTQACGAFAASHRHLLRQQTVNILRQAQQDGARVLIVTANNGLLTGRFHTPNCYGAEKVRRVEECIKEASHITAYGDSRGDRELLAWADEGTKI